VEQVAAQGRRERAREVLVDVVVGVDQARGDEAPVRRERARRRRLLPRPADRLDAAVAQRDPAAGQLAPLGVHGDDELGAAHHEVGRRGH
jgi:hypothetical protein